MSVIVEDATFRYGDEWAVEHVALDIAEGELFGLLGPSGCGKTTTLRMIAGFIRPASGRIRISGVDVTGEPRERRRIGMVFQNYALFPHMTVFENVAFGLTARRVEKTEAARRVREALSLVQLDGLDKRPVTDLSGGQQQRVAVARAIVVEPDVLLLDEPLSNLDARLRMHTGQELRALQRRLGTTTIYVTHDQTEALSLCDRIAVMADGRVQQVGTPEEVCAHPASRTVAEFIGSANVIPVDRVERDGEGWVAVVGDARVEVSADVSEGDVSALTVHAHAVMVSEERRSERGWFETIVAGRRFLGADVELALEWNGLTVTALVRPGAPGSAAETGTSVWCRLPPESIWPLPRE